MCLAVLVLLLAFSFQGSRGLWEPDEGHYVGVADTMRRTGDWLVPRLEQDPFLDKPPLTYWGIVAGMQILGHNEWGARCGHAVAFILTALAVSLLGALLWDEKTGLLAGLVYATSVLPFAAANIVTPDTPLALWSTAAVLCFWAAERAPRTRARTGWRLAMAVCFGLAFLAKGPAVLPIVAALFVWLAWHRRLKAFLDVSWLVPGALAFAVLAFAWYGYIGVSFPGAFEYFLGNQVTGRLWSDEYHRNAEPLGALKVYGPVLVLGLFPWCLFWPSVARRARAAGVRIGTSPASSLLVCWFVLPLLIFVAASSRLPLYLLPLFAPLALATARGLRSCGPAWLARFPSSRGSQAVAAWVLCLIAIKGLTAVLPSERDSRAMWQRIDPYVGEKPFEICVVEDHRYGLAFYGGPVTEHLTMRRKSRPVFAPREQLDVEIREMQTCGLQHVFLVKQRHADSVRRRLLHACKQIREIPLGLGRALLICGASTGPQSPSGPDAGTSESEPWGAAWACRTTPLTAGNRPPG